MGDRLFRDDAPTTLRTTGATETVARAAVRAAPAPPKPGEVLGKRYVLEAELARGASAIVYRAFDQAARATVALKLWAPSSPGPRFIEERLDAELRASRALRHPNVCRVFDLFEMDGHRFLTMELATAGNLRNTLCNEGSHRPLLQRVVDAQAVVDGIAAVHAAGIVHRDLKPENILRMDDGRLVISDLGFARTLGQTTAHTGMVGTKGYLAPELLSGATATFASDVWSLGIVLHELLFGVRPRWRDGTSVWRGPAPLVGVSVQTSPERRLLALVKRCLAARPSDRPGDGAEVQRRFVAALDGPFVSRRPALVSALAGAAAGLVLVGWPSRGRLWSRQSASLHGEAGVWTRRYSLVMATEAPRCLRLLPPNRRKVRAIWTSGRAPVDIDVVTGEQTSPPLLPETYAQDCPEVSPDGQSLAFVQSRSGHRPELMISRRADGGEAVSVAEGRSPRWMPTGEGLFFRMDDARMVFRDNSGERTLLPEPAAQTDAVLDLALARNGNEIGMLVLEKGGARRIELREFPSFQLLRSVPLGQHSVSRLTVSADATSFQFGHGTLWVELRDDGGMNAVARVPRRLIDVVLWSERGPVVATLSSDGAGGAFELALVGSEDGAP